jgi:DNA polymerase-3 subunit delta'
MLTKYLPWHAALWSAVRELQCIDRLPHALLLNGRTGLGKLLFAERIAAALVCLDPDVEGNACDQCTACHTRKAGSHPDIKRIEPEEPGKPIRIDVVREATERSVLAAEADGYKVFILNPADKLTQGAANALLKTLEEPTSRTLLMLVTSRPANLPATIRSRCQQIRFDVPDGETSKSWLMVQDNGARALQALDVAGGAPLLAMAMAGDGSADLMAAMRNDLHHLVVEQTNPIVLAANWQNYDLELVLKCLAQWAIDLIRLKTLKDPPLIFDTVESTGLHRLAQQIESKRLFQFLDDIATTQRQSLHNLNVQLTLEHHLTYCSKLTIR